MRLSEQIISLLEARGGKVLSKLPKGTVINPRNGWGSWDGHYAMVFEKENEFDPVNMTRVYTVWKAIGDYDKKPMPATRQGWVHYQPDMGFRPDRFENMSFRFGNRGGEQLAGMFAKPQEYTVKVNPSNLSVDERRYVLDVMDDEGFLNVTGIKLSKADWTKALKLDVDEIVDAFPRFTPRDANQLRWNLSSDRLSWDSIAGVYAQNKKGDLKFVLSRRF